MQNVLIGAKQQYYFEGDNSVIYITNGCYYLGNNYKFEAGKFSNVKLTLHIDLTMHVNVLNGSYFFTYYSSFHNKKM